MASYAFIPARGGSTRIKDKNLQTIGGVSLVARAIRVANEAQLEAWVSTDSAEIAEEAQRHGAFVDIRRPEYAGGHAQIEDALADWIHRAEIDPEDMIVLLQPTTPFRSPSTVLLCLLEAEEHGACLTVESAPGTWFVGVGVEGRVVWRNSRRQERPRSQDLQAYLREDGNVYAFTGAHFDRHGLRMHPTESRYVESEAHEAFEIDWVDDLVVARAMVAAGVCR